MSINLLVQDTEGNLILHRELQTIPKDGIVIGPTTTNDFVGIFRHTATFNSRQTTVISQEVPSIAFEFPSSVPISRGNTSFQPALGAEITNPHAPHTIELSCQKD